MAPHSSTLAWKIPWTEEPGRPWGRKELDTTERLHFHFLSLYLLPGFPDASVVKNPPANAGMQVRSLGQEDSLEKEMTIHSSILAREIE